MVHGDQRNFVSALVALDPERVQAWAEQHGMAGQPYETVATSEPMRALIAEHVEQLNHRLNRWETVKKFVILPKDLTVEGGELTPSLKVKRRFVEKKYATLLDELYT